MQPDEHWFKRYDRSRLANIAFADEFNMRMQSKGNTVTALLVSFPWQRDLVDPVPEAGWYSYLRQLIALAAEGYAMTFLLCL